MCLRSALRSEVSGSYIFRAGTSSSIGREPVSTSNVVRFSGGVSRKERRRRRGRRRRVLLPTSTLYTGIDSTVTYSRPASTIQQRGGCLSTSGGAALTKSSGKPDCESVVEMFRRSAKLKLKERRSFLPRAMILETRNRSHRNCLELNGTTIVTAFYAFYNSRNNCVR